MTNYKRILIKLSGEALMGDRSFGLDINIVKQIALEIKKVYWETYLSALLPQTI